MSSSDFPLLTGTSAVVFGGVILLLGAFVIAQMCNGVNSMADARLAEPVKPAELQRFPAPAGVSCPACGMIVAEGRRFCSECGTALAAAVPISAEARCFKCRGVLAPDARFCHVCGTAVQETKAAMGTVRLHAAGAGDN